MSTLFRAVKAITLWGLLGATGCATSKGDASSITENKAPIAKDVLITDVNGGDVRIGDRLTGSYTYEDAEGDPEGITTFRWTRDGDPIQGAIGQNYTVVSADGGSSIAFEVIPVSTRGTLAGSPTLSSDITVANLPPTVSSLRITDDNGGDAVVGDQLMGVYVYHDADGDQEGGSIFRWKRNDQPIAGASEQNYQLVNADAGKTITFEVTPIAATGIIRGLAVTSDGIEAVPAGENSLSIASAATTVSPGVVYTFDVDYSLAIPPGEIRAALRDSSGLILASTCLKVSPEAGSKSLALPVPPDLSAANENTLSVDVGLFANGGCASVNVDGGFRSASQNVTKLDPPADPLLIADFDDGFENLQLEQEFGLSFGEQDIERDSSFIQNGAGAWRMKSDDPWEEGVVIGTKFKFPSIDASSTNVISFAARTKENHFAEGVSMFVELKFGNGSTWQQVVKSKLTDSYQTFKIPLDRTNFMFPEELSSEEAAASCGEMDRLDVVGISLVLFSGDVVGKQLIVYVDDIAFAFDPGTSTTPLVMVDNLIDDFDDEPQYRASHQNDLGQYTDDDNTMSSENREQGDKVANGVLTLQGNGTLVPNHAKGPDFWATSFVGDGDAGADLSQYSAIRVRARGLTGGESFRANVRNAQGQGIFYHYSPVTLKSTFDDYLFPLAQDCARYRGLKSFTMRDFSPQNATIIVETVDLIP